MYSIKSAVSAFKALGVTLYLRGASFRVWAPYASSVIVRFTPGGGRPAQDLSLGADPADPGTYSAGKLVHAGSRDHRNGPLRKLLVRRGYGAENGI